MFLSFVLKEFIGRCLCEEQGNCKLVSKIVLEFEMKVAESLIRNVTYIDVVKTISSSYVIKLLYETFFSSLYY